MSNHTFKDLNINDSIQKALGSMGFEHPTSIQEQCIPKIAEGKDLVGQAPTGTGKTAAFGIPLLEQIDTNLRETQAIIQCPTRELAMQVSGELKKLGRFMDDLQVLTIYGGQAIGKQLKVLKKGPQIIVGTPGRTIDHLNRGTLNLNTLKMVVFDEADEMLNMGFREDMEKILNYANNPVQMIMFSATFPGEIRKIMNRYMQDPETVTVERTAATAPSIDQYVVETRGENKVEILRRFMKGYDFKLGLIFCNTRRMTKKLTRKIQDMGFNADFINGDLSQNQRDRVMNKFRDHKIEMLIATDVAARGIDVDDIDVVFNYEIPQDTEYYIHRIGRTGRYGQEGMAITFTTSKKNKQLRSIERTNKVKLELLEIPSKSDVMKTKLDNYMSSISKILNNEDLSSYIDHIESMHSDQYSSKEIAAALLKMNVESNGNGAMKNGKHSKSNGAAKNGSMKKLHFNIGRKNKIHAGDMVGAIAGETGIPGDAIGNIDIKKKDTFVDIPSAMVNQVMDGMKNNQIKGNKVNVKMT